MSVTTGVHQAPSFSRRTCYQGNPVEPGYVYLDPKHLHTRADDGGVVAPGGCVPAATPSDLYPELGGLGSSSAQGPQVGQSSPPRAYTRAPTTLGTSQGATVRAAIQEARTQTALRQGFIRNCSFTEDTSLVINLLNKQFFTKVQNSNYNQVFVELSQSPN